MIFPILYAVAGATLYDRPCPLVDFVQVLRDLEDPAAQRAAKHDRFSTGHESQLSGAFLAGHVHGAAIDQKFPLLYHTRMELLYLLDDDPTGRRRDRFDRAVRELDELFSVQSEKLCGAKRLACDFAEAITAMEPYIDQLTSAVCSLCLRVCCINRHSYHDYRDLIFVAARGLKPPLSDRGLPDTDPCQFLSTTGCRMKRTDRPFRCTWYFCDALLRHMAEGPARPYREFVAQMQIAIDLRRSMVGEFLRILSDGPF
ncbi:MAG: hypothetical protein MZV70_28305 [Desulfobacterales bacterium]|nr:hypothetical protein [Desulfobacterales bacterium]